MDSTSTYTTISEADEYYSVDSFEDTWNGFSNEQKLKKLVYSTRHLDSMFSFQGSKYESSQVLQFPRDFTDDDTDLGSVPEVVKQAQLELLKWLYNNNDVEPQYINNFSIAGQISVNFSDKNYENQIVPIKVIKLLKNFLLSSIVVGLIRG